MDAIQLDMFAELEKFKTAITSDVREYTTECECCKKEIPTSEIFEYEGKKLCMDCWENKAFVDDEENDVDDEENDVDDEENDVDDEENDGWSVCPTCNEKVGQLCKSGLCAECDFKKKHPDAEKKFCEQCIHFHYHNLYDENDHTECCCKLHLEGKNRHEWTYLCKDFVKVYSVEDFDRKYEGLMKYASYKGKEKCEGCGKKFRFTYHGLCIPCYEKKRKLVKEIEQ